MAPTLPWGQHRRTQLALPALGNYWCSTCYCLCRTISISTRFPAQLESGGSSVARSPLFNLGPKLVMYTMCWHIAQLGWKCTRTSIHGPPTPNIVGLNRLCSMEWGRGLSSYGAQPRHNKIIASFHASSPTYVTAANSRKANLAQSTHRGQPPLSQKFAWHLRLAAVGIRGRGNIGRGSCLG